jgi:hypothetical protein
MPPKDKCHGFSQVVVFKLSFWFITYLHHTSSPLGHYKKLDQINKGVKTKCVTNCPKEIGNPIICQGPHNPSIVCQPLEHDCNEWRTIPTLWPSKDW